MAEVKIEWKFRRMPLMDQINAAIEYFADAVKETDEIINDCSDDLKHELLAQKEHFVVALDALKKQVPHTGW